MATEWFKLYTRKDPPCKHCDHARELLQVYGKDYHEIDINEPGVKEMFSERGFHTVPQVFVEEKHIGGVLAIEHYLREEQNAKEKEFRTKGKRVVTHTA